jgi:hypothetical protein
MSIYYCAILTTKNKLKVAESANFKQYKMQYKSLLPEIERGVVSDHVEFDDNYFTYIKSKEIILVSISPKRLGTEKPSLFLETLVNKIANIYGGIKQFSERVTDKELCLQEQLGPQIEITIKEFESGFEGSRAKVQNINKDVEEIKGDLKKAYKQAVGNIGNLDEVLITSEKLKDNAKVYNKNARKLKNQTSCCSPCVIKLSILFGILTVLGTAYVIVAFVRCGNINAFCDINKSL